MITLKNGGRELHQHPLLVTVFFVLAISKFTVVLGNGIARCIPSEKQALLDFKKGLADPADLLASWKIVNEDCCRWNRVGCDNQTGHVVMLDLRPVIIGSADGSFGTWQSMVGEISSSLLELPFLGHLDLSNNVFKNMPGFIGSLRNLIYLNLSSNNIVGTIPYQLGDLSQLQTLDLSWNSNIKAQDFEWLSRLTSLRTLILSHMNLLGAVDWIQAIKTHPSLSTLKLTRCHFPGVDPLSLSGVTPSKSLAVLHLFGNTYNASIHSWLFNISTALVDLQIIVDDQLKGPVPDFFGDMISLVHLDLSYNQLEGGIPASFGNLCSLKSLDLTHNNLSAPLSDTLKNIWCSKNSVEILRFSSNQLTGSIPDMTEFTALKELHLDANSLDGSFPISFKYSSGLEILNVEKNQLVGSLPNLLNFSSLKELHLANNELNGSLRLCIGKLSNLTILDVSGNQLNGVVSEAHFSNLSKLQVLDLSFNSLGMDVSSEWIPAFQLDMIKLCSCKLGPQFPRWLRSQKNFSHLDISNSSISEAIPRWFWNLPPTLQYLNLSLNKVSGKVPNLSSKFYTFPALDLSSNLFYGPIPSLLYNTTVLNLSKNMFSGSLSFLCTVVDAALTYLDLSNNLLSGGLTDCWVQLKLLVILNLENNNFSGRIPSSLGSLTRIETIRLRNNSFTGEIPSALGGCYWLELLDLGENKLTGSIPPWIGQNLTRLIVLRLRSNELHGNIPSTLCHLNSIQILDLSLNKLSGSIPTCLNNLTAMAQNRSSVKFISHSYEYYYSYWNGSSNNAGEGTDGYIDSALVVWKGYEQQYGKTLGLLKIIDLSSNHLNGSIPEEVRSLLGIKSLNLSRNNLTGTIPGDIGKLKALESLDLSRNQLSGKIPSSLTELTFLAVLDLSNNNLSGRIPTGTQLQSFNASSYLWNPRLCGPPLPNACLSNGTNQYPPSNRDDGEWFDKEWLYAGIGVGFLVGFWGFCGPLIISKSRRRSYFQCLEKAADFLYFKIVRSIQDSKAVTNSGFLISK